MSDMNDLWKATRELLATDHVILNHGQVTWTTPELAPPSPNYHTNGRTFQLSTDLRASLPDTAGLYWYWPRTHGMPAMSRYLDHCATAAPQLREVGKFNVAVSELANIYDTLFSCSRAFGYIPRNFEPWLSDEDDTRVGTPYPKFLTTPTGGLLSFRQI
ncbi:hypothetical protein TNCV_4189661 [Trichonephila clavipes]|nr:hypothetical protein TNCV_4189661 [Trichonephila clavipes]